jgi:hypothetical protein
MEFENEKLLVTIIKQNLRHFQTPFSNGGTFGT